MEVEYHPHPGRFYVTVLYTDDVGKAQQIRPAPINHGTINVYFTKLVRYNGVTLYNMCVLRSAILLRLREDNSAYINNVVG